MKCSNRGRMPSWKTAASASVVVAVTLIALGLLPCGRPVSAARFGRGAAVHAAAQAPTEKPHRRALLVAVQYETKGKDPNDSWPALHTVADVTSIESELIHRYRFDRADIKVLSTPQETTHASIVGWFKKWLIDDTVLGRGDEIYFHYSGHGGEVPNDDTLTGDLDPFHEEDGLDKTLIPSDYGHKNHYKAPKVNGKWPCNDIRDSELKRLLRQLAAKKPGDVFLTFDCCHAGGNTRGDNEGVRGDIWRGPAPLKRPQVHPATTRRDSRGPDVPDVNGADFPGFVVMAATNSDQVDQEMLADDGKTWMGPLSYALCKAMDHATRTTSYRDLMGEVTSIMAIGSPAQTPQIEGPIDLAVLSASAVPPEPKIEIVMRDPEALTDPDTAKLQPFLQAGFLQGMAKGSTVALRWFGEPVDAPPFASATLENVGALQSSLKFDPPASGAMTIPQILAALKGVSGDTGGKGVPPRAAYATLTRQMYADAPLAVSLAPGLPPSEAAALRNALSKLAADRWATLVPPVTGARWDLKILTAGAARGAMPLARGGGFAFRLPADDNALVIAQQGGGYIVPALPGENATPQQIENAIRGEARRRLFASLTSPTTGTAAGAQYQVEFRFHPVDAVAEKLDGKMTLKSGTLQEKPLPASGQNQFVEGDVAELEVRNIGTRPAYVTILNLRGDGKVSAVYPLANNPDDNRIACKDYAVAPQKRPWNVICDRDGNKALFVFKSTDDRGIAYPTAADIYKVFVTKEPAEFWLLVDPDKRASRGGPIAGADTALGRLIQRATGTARGPDAIAEPPNTGWSVSTVTYNVLPAASASLAAAKP